MAKKPKHFKPSAAAETAFARALKRVAQVSGHIVEAHISGSRILRMPEMMKALKDYSELIEPWAQRQAAKMIEQVSKNNRKAYIKKSKEMGARIRADFAERETGENAAAMMHEQVSLIKSIPREAGERAQKLAMEAALSGERAIEVAKALQDSTQVATSRAMLIARTEVSRANASLTRARAESIGASGYIWRTTMDGAERESHAKMNGKYVAYNNPPRLDDGTQGHAGTFPNCRCYQDVQFDET
jgi:SPP1 gp7 family putative phage head morphogenesis protein